MTPPTEMTNQLRAIIQQPAVQQMTKYAFIGSKETVKKQVKAFMDKTQAEELIAITNIYSAKERIKSYKLFAEIMNELNS